MMEGSEGTGERRGGESASDDEKAVGIAELLELFAELVGYGDVGLEG